MRPRIPPPFLMLIAACLMWALRRWLPLGRLIPTPWNQLAVLPAAAGVAIAAAAFVRFRQARTTVNPMDPRKASCLVTDGVFRISRNPMYLGLLLLLIGWAVWLGSASPWLVPPLFVIVISFAQIAPEEHALEELFGEEYRAYRQRVARWIGRVLMLMVALCAGWGRSDPPSVSQPAATFLKAARLLDVQGLVEGPRILVATRGVAAVGQYNPFGVSPDLKDFPTSAQMISGPEDGRRAVREQIGYGADLPADSMPAARACTARTLRNIGSK